MAIFLPFLYSAYLYFKYVADSNEKLWIILSYSYFGGIRCHSVDTRPLYLDRLSATCRLSIYGLSSKYRWIVGQCKVSTNILGLRGTYRRYIGQVSSNMGWPMIQCISVASLVNVSAGALAECRPNDTYCKHDPFWHHKLLHSMLFLSLEQNQRPNRKCLWKH